MLLVTDPIPAADSLTISARSDPRANPQPNPSLNPSPGTQSDESVDYWPAEVDLILSAMRAGGTTWLDQRRRQRIPYRVRSQLTFNADRSRSATLYSRDVDPHGMGFITQEPLALGYGGTATFLSPAGKSISVACTVTRCREAVRGWYEGALTFTRSQAIFESEG